MTRSRPGSLSVDVTGCLSASLTRTCGGRQPALARSLRVAVAVLVCLSVAAGASAQYFGQNRVRYRRFHYRVLLTPHFEVCYYRSEQQAALIAARLAERWYSLLSLVLNHHPAERQRLILYADRADFEQANVAPGELVDEEGGVAGIVRRRIVLPLDVSLRESNRIIGHELAHAFQLDMTRRRSWAGGAPGASRLPPWFVDGMAAYLARGPVDADAAMWVRDAAQRHALPAIRQLGGRAFLPYRWGQIFWAYIAGRWGDGALGDILRTASSNGNVDAALRRETNLTIARLSRDWQAALEAQAQPVLDVTRPPGAYGRPLAGLDASRSGPGGSPSISPDGRRFLFLSQSSRLAVDLLLGNADTGAVIRRVTSMSLDPRVDLLQSAASAGSWAPDNRRFVLADQRDGHPELVMIDVARGRVERRIPFPGLGQILGPSWSPDGRSIVFSAMNGGLSDLYLYRLADGRLRRLTHDVYADLEPAWSPDGRSIAFVTDQFSTRLYDLQIGRYQLARLDLATGRISAIPTFSTGKSISPQWAPDGRSLFFVSDRDGVSNLYRVWPADGRIRQVTNLQTGISGLTGLSPAISMATQVPRMLFSALVGGADLVYAIDSPATLEGQPVTDTVAALHPALLPPADPVEGGLLVLRRDLALGLVPETAFRERPYHSGLSLDRIGLPDQVAVGDPIASFIGGGVSLFWSDLLDNHTLSTSLQVGSTFGPRFVDRLQNGAASIAYQDLTGRWTRGVVVQQVPHLAGAFRSVSETVNGLPVTVKEKIEFRQIYRGLFAVASYPFDTSRRLELSAGYQHLTFDQESQVQSSTSPVGSLVGVASPLVVPSAGPLHLVQGTVAFVSDHSVFGATSPVEGQRYRLQVTAVGGTVGYEDILADYRRYIRPAPWYTIAFRVMEDGRYGSGAEDPRLLPLSVGYRNVVRGYDLSSFSANDCQPTATQPCPAIDQLLGSRIAAANVELRFPLQRSFGFGSQYFRSLPTELAVFADAGYAWHDDANRPPFLVGPRSPVTSVGVAVRVNLFGFAVGEMDLVRPLQRPHAGWIFAFGLSPGF